MSVTGNLMRRLSPARRIAFEILSRVRTGAYAADELLALGDSVSPRDIALANNIVFGTLRFQAQLDYLIQLHTRRDPAGLDAPVLIALRAGIFQLRYLDRIPAHAAVNESVEWVKQHSRAAAGLANAVLRKINRQPLVWPDLAIELSCPAWLLDSWTARYGSELAHGVAAVALREPDSYVRSLSPPGAESNLLPTSVEHCYRAEGPPPDGARLQDIGSQSIIPLLKLHPGETYLDLCAAPGNKTLQALETKLGFAVACDVSFKRLRQVPPVCHRVALDATRSLPFDEQFDRVFIDAPCSGTGTLSRNPEIKWRLAPGDLMRFADRQQLILRNGLLSLAPDGRLVYATCSLQPEENECVVSKVLADFPQRRLLNEVWRLPGRDEGDGFYAAVIT